jgi:gliding motility-associated-like protein
MVIKYFPGGSRQISVELVENQNISTSFFATLPNTCWHHITVIRRSDEAILYHNGIELKRASTISSTRVNIFNDEAIIIGNSDCNVDAGFRGIMDEIRIYNRALKREEVEDLYLFPDNIANGLRFDDLKDTTIFLGGSVPIRLTETCATQYEWTPSTDVDNPSSPTPIISPSTGGFHTYMVEMTDTICSAIDSIRIEVVDPTTIQCGDIFLPTAFTPNGDNLNDAFGISNPFSAGEILAFEIYDRWGNLVFSSTNVLDKWDGSYRGKPVNPGVFLYKLQYRCNDKEELLSGSVTVVR